MPDEANVTTERVRVAVDLLKPETCPPALKKFYSDADREGIRMAMEKGHVVAETRNVKVSKDKSGTGQEELWPYIIYRAVEGPGMTALSRQKMKAATKKPDNFDTLTGNDKLRAENDAKDGACDYFNYGFSLTIMQPIRTMLTNSLGGVDKEIDKQVAQAMKMGIFPSAEEARAMIIAQREKIGLEIPAETGE